MIGRVNTGGGKGAALTVTAPAGATVTVSKDGKTLTRVAGDDGVVVFRGLETGTWTLSITDGEQTASKTVEIVADYATEISYNAIPEFTYTGDFELVNDSDEPITTSPDNWKIRLLTSGTLTFQALNGAEKEIDVFLVGGGGGGAGYGGGGGGYTKTQKAVSVTAGTSYTITIGAGGASKSDGGSTSAFGVTAAGGKGTVSSTYNGAAGGSGGGAYRGSGTGGTGGSDGSDGADKNVSDTSPGYGGKGQGTTTREFGESGKRLYAGGGGGATHTQWSTDYGAPGGDGGGGIGGSNTKTPGNGETNTGGGAGSGYSTGGTGGSGIVVIRNKR